jgi:hypothetical protein
MMRVLVFLQDGGKGEFVRRYCRPQEPPSAVRSFPPSALFAVEHDDQNGGVVGFSARDWD